MINRYHISDRDLVTLAAGYGSAETLATLRSAQLSKHLLLIRSVLGARAPAASSDAGLTVLAEAQRTAPVQVGELLAEPWVGAWAARCLRDAGNGVPGASALSYLDTLAAVAAWRAGVDADLTVAARGGRVCLPATGAAAFDVSDETPVRIRVRAGMMTLRAGSTEVVVSGGSAANVARSAGGWYPRRRLTAEHAGVRLSVAFDDTDPWRDCYQMPVADRLDAVAFAGWRRLLDEAWRLLVRSAPARASEVAAGLRSMVPLADASGEPGRSGTSRDAFGAFALTTPADAVTFAVTIVHELQHTKLSALCDLLPLYEHRSTRYFSPWRTDPRPISGLLQGAYAFLGVADLWQRLRAVPRLRERAEWEFAVVREQVGRAVRQLVGCPELTGVGRRFVAGLQAGLQPMWAVPVPPTVSARAKRTLWRDELAWHRAHGQAGDSLPVVTGS
jgi:HEXXH motif-containing protein